MWWWDGPLLRRLLCINERHISLEHIFIPGFIESCIPHHHPHSSILVCLLISNLPLTALLHCQAVVEWRNTVCAFIRNSCATTSTTARFKATIFTHNKIVVAWKQREYLAFSHDRIQSKHRFCAPVKQCHRSWKSMTLSHMTEQNGYPKSSEHKSEFFCTPFFTFHIEMCISIVFVLSKCEKLLVAQTGCLLIWVYCSPHEFLLWFVSRQ